jgi:hypothetical protein
MPSSRVDVHRPGGELGLRVLSSAEEVVCGRRGHSQSVVRMSSGPEVQGGGARAGAEEAEEGPGDEGLHRVGQGGECGRGERVEFRGGPSQAVPEADGGVTGTFGGGDLDGEEREEEREEGSKKETRRKRRIGTGSE